MLGEDISTALSLRIRQRADHDGLPADHPLRLLAIAFNDATKGFYGSPQTVPVATFVARWARLRRAWCDYSGEALV